MPNLDELKKLLENFKQALIGQTVDSIELDVVNSIPTGMFRILIGGRLLLVQPASLVEREGKKIPAYEMAWITSKTNGRS